MAFLKSVSILLVSSILLVCCSVDYNPADLQQDPETSQKSYNHVDSRLWVYFERFENEAKKRGRNINLNALEVTGDIEDIPEDGVAGTCRYGSHIHDVTVDKNFWDRSSSYRREMVVFHELGHCVLYRGHRDDANSSGVCNSIMNSGLADCLVAYNQANMQEYLDELFYFSGQP